MIVFFLTIKNSFAQTYSITPNDTFQVTALMEDLETLTIYQLNTSNDSIIFKWKKVSESVPAKWDASICDNLICNATLVDSGMSNPVAPAETGFLLLHITAHVNFGTAAIRYAVWDIKNPALKDTLTFIMKVNSTSGISDVKNKDVFNISPNPINGKMIINRSVEGVFTYSVFDIAGREILMGTGDGKVEIVSTDNIPNGIYFITLYQEHKIYTSKKIIVTH